MSRDTKEHQRVAIVSLSPIARDARVLRQIDYAQREYAVDVVGLGEWIPPWPGVTYHRIEPHKTTSVKVRRLAALLVGQIAPSVSERAYWILPRSRQVRRILLRGDYDLIHANEPPALPACVMAARLTGAKLLYDAHEYILDRRGYGHPSRIALRHYGYLLAKYLPEADACVTVSEGIAGLYRKELGVDVRVVMNAPDTVKLGRRDVNPGDIRLIHHGFATPTRHLESHVHLAGLLDPRFSLHFMLLNPESEYVAKLKVLARKTAPDRVHFWDTVRPADIVPTIAAYDLGVFILPVRILSHKYSLPNKFLDFVAAGLAIAIGPSPEMARLVRRFDMGVVAQDFEPQTLARELNALQPEEISRMKRNALAASQQLNAATEMGKLMAIYRETLSKGERCRNGGNAGLREFVHHCQR